MTALTVVFVLWQWLTDAGVPEDAVEASPWGDHLFIHTTAAIFRGLTGLDVHAHDHTSSDPTVAGRLILLATGATLADDHSMRPHVAHLQVAGTIARGTTRAEPDAQLPGYPFGFWPPPPLMEARASADGTTVSGVVALTCQDWPSLQYPFQGGLPEAPEIPLQPCGVSGGSVYEISMVLTAADGTTYSTSTNEPNSQYNCEAAAFAALVCPSEYGCVSEKELEAEELVLGVCSFQFSGLSLESTARCVVIVVWPAQCSLCLTCSFVDRYNVSYSITYTGTDNFGELQWVGYPNALPLQLSPSPVVKPATLYTQYSIPSGVVACSADNVQSIGVLQLSNSGFYSNADLKSFYSQIGISEEEYHLVTFVDSIPDSADLETVLDDNGYTSQTISLNQNQPGTETSLDVEYISGMAPGAVTKVYHGGYFLSSLGNEISPMLSVILGVQYVLVHVLLVLHTRKPLFTVVADCVQILEPSALGTFDELRWPRTFW